MKPFATSSQNSFCTPRRCDGAPGDFSADLPVNSLTQLDGLPINTSYVGVLRRPIEFTLRRGVRIALQLVETEMTPGLGRQVERFDDEAHGRRTRGLPPDDATAEDIGNERNVDDARPRETVSEIVDQSWFCWSALNWRWTSSVMRGAGGSALVVNRLFAREASRMPWHFMSRCTWSRPTSSPALRAARVSLRRP